jgi:hypothetical protein
MSTQEFYIRGEADTEARGPFNIDQLASLAEAGQVDGDTLYYDAAIEQWVTTGSNPELMATLFPEKKRLRMKQKIEVKTINVENEGDEPIRVEEMLAAAEGKTKETAGKGDPKAAFELVAGWGRRVLTLIVAVTMASMLLPHIDAIYALEWRSFLTTPSILFGIFDLFLLIMLLLGATSVYPLVRFRALLGFGFLGLMHYLAGETQFIMPLIAGSAGIYFVTAAVNWTVLIAAGLLGLLGSGFYAFLVLG